MSDFMQLLFSERADAVHLHPGERPILEVRRVLLVCPLEGPPLQAQETEELLREVASDDQFSQFEHEGMVCFDFRFRDAAAFQVMGFREGGHVRVEVRRLR
jgi:Tfp pilus assembly pilus retraction ATPase PilT